MTDQQRREELRGDKEMSKVREALEGFITDAGCWGYGPLDYEWFYCPFCKVSSLDWTDMPHEKYCRVTKAREALAALDGGWIKCSERLPSRSGYYVTWQSYEPSAGDTPRGRVHAAWFEFNKGAFSSTKTFTHWLELLLPPEDK